jgi:hypothetical protein
MASLFGRLDEMMLGVRVRIPRYVWNVAKPRGEPGPGIAEAGIEKTVTKAIVAIRSLFMMTLRCGGLRRRFASAPFGVSANMTSLSRGLDRHHWPSDLKSPNGVELGKMP